MTYKAAIVGCGRMAGLVQLSLDEHPYLILPYRHAPSYQALPNVDLVAACDIDPERREEFREKWRMPSMYADYREMIKTERPDIVSVTTQAPQHAEVTIFCAEHSVKGVYCEKPMACSLAEADAVVEACKRNGTQYNIGTLRRYHPGFEMVRQTVLSGEVGEARVTTFFGSGSLLHSGSHYIDTLCYLLGDPEPVFVQGGWSSPPDAMAADRFDEDPGTPRLYVRFHNDTDAHVVPTPCMHEYELTCTKGYMRSMNNGLRWMLRKPVSPSGGIVWGEAEFPEFEQISPTVRCIVDLVDSIESGRPSRGNVDIARKTMEISMALVESHRQGGVRVDVPIADRSLYIPSR